jgi:hypothetical protein
LRTIQLCLSGLLPTFKLIPFLLPEGLVRGGAFAFLGLLTFLAFPSSFLIKGFYPFNLPFHLFSFATSQQRIQEVIGLI